MRTREERLLDEALVVVKSLMYELSFWSGAPRRAGKRGQAMRGGAELLGRVRDVGPVVTPCLACHEWHVGGEPCPGGARPGGAP